MDRIEVGDGQEFASAMSTFPLVNLDNPQDEWYTSDSVRGPMQPSAPSAESPIGSLELPSKDDVTVETYKKKYNPEKEAADALDDIDEFGLYQLAATALRMEIFLTREQITWRGDEVVDGLVGPEGGAAHPEIPTEHVLTPATPWSDSTNGTPYADLTDLAFRIRDNGRFSANQPRPTVFAPPSVTRDVAASDDMENRVSGVRVQSLDTDEVQSIVDPEIGNIAEVYVYVPRTNANGEYIDSDGNVVDDLEDAARDNILEPWDPSAGAQVRNVVLGRPGVASAYVPWYSDRLDNHADNVPPTGDVAMDSNNGFITQVWTDNDPISSWFKAMQEVGFKLATPENWGVIRGV